MDTMNDFIPFWWGGMESQAVYGSGRVWWRLFTSRAEQKAEQRREGRDQVAAIPSQGLPLKTYFLSWATPPSASRASTKQPAAGE